MFTRFIKSEDGSNVVEYALIIAIISISLIILLQPLGAPSNFNSFISRFRTCLINTCI
jgi:pilus assembly protein Flp/PilA